MTKNLRKFYLVSWGVSVSSFVAITLLFWMWIAGYMREADREGASLGRLRSRGFLFKAQSYLFTQPRKATYGLDRNFRPIKGAPKRLTADDVADLNALPFFNSLALHGVDFDGETSESLSKLKHVSCLELERCTIDERGWQAIEKIKALGLVKLRNMEVDDHEIEALCLKRPDLEVRRDDVVAETQ